MLTGYTSSALIKRHYRTFGCIAAPKPGQFITAPRCASFPPLMEKRDGRSREVGGKRRKIQQHHRHQSLFFSSSFCIGTICLCAAVHSEYFLHFLPPFPFPPRRIVCLFNVTSILRVRTRPLSPHVQHTLGLGSRMEGGWGAPSPHPPPSPSLQPRQDNRQARITLTPELIICPFNSGSMLISCACKTDSVLT